MVSRPDGVAELYRQSLPRLGAYAYLLTGNDAEAEHLVQAAIVKVCARPRRLPDAAHAEAYVRATIRTLHIHGLRGSRFRRARPATPDAAAGPAESDAVSLAMATLAPRVRAVVAMYYWEDLSVADISAALDLSEATVKGCLRDGRDTLAPLLGDDDEPERTDVTDVQP